MTPLDMHQLFDYRYYTSPPQQIQAGRTFVRMRFINGRRILRVPIRMNGKLAYLIGVIIGDGYLSKAMRRKSHGRGFHWKMVITGPHDYIVCLRNIFHDLFSIRGGIIQDSRKRDSWQLRFSCLILHRFFARVIGIPQGRKTTHGGWTRLELVREFPLHFLKGLIDSDGHIGKRYIGIIQKRLRFLIRIKNFAHETLGLDFHGPFVNSRKNGLIASWIISISNERARTWLLDRLGRIRIM